MRLVCAGSSVPFETVRPGGGTMIDLEALTDFVLVATHGGVTQASRASGRPKASLSRKVMELEASLGVRLFERGARSVRLTEEGELLFARTSGPLADITEAAELLRDGACTTARAIAAQRPPPCSVRSSSAGSQPPLPWPTRR